MKFTKSFAILAMFFIVASMMNFQIISHKISPFQSSFLPHRGTDTNAIIATELLHSFKSRKGNRGWFLLKLDLEKAYDKLEWGFIRNSLLSFGLDQPSTALVMSCISTVRSSVLVNGSPTSQFSPTRGIRQGDPLSPYVFIICMEILSKLILDATENEDWKPFSLGRQKTHISHLLFADDILLCGEANLENALTVQRILDQICGLSGQSVSNQKSRILFSANTNHIVRREVVDTLKIKETEDLSPYLGFPLMEGRPKKRKVYFIVEKMRKKLSAWKESCLSRAGRLTLVKAALNAIPNYYMQVLPLPVSCLKEMNKVMGDFIWGRREGGRGLHLVKWGAIAKSTNQGGLGIRCCKDLNKAHYLNLWWKLAEKKENVAMKFLKDKYMKRDGRFKSFNGGSFIWKEMGKMLKLYNTNLQWGIGRGDKIPFWEGEWLNGCNPRALMIGPLAKNAEKLKIQDCMHDSHFMEEVIQYPLPQEFISQAGKVQFNELDDFSYSLFTVNRKFSFSKALEAIRHDEEIKQEMEWVWKLTIPPKLKVFLWLACWDRLPHGVTLAKRDILQSDLCSMCQIRSEDADHILRRCPVAQDLWMLIDPGLPNDFFTLSFLDWLKSNCLAPPPKDNNTVLPWQILFPFITWTLWLQRNDHIFSNSTPNPDSCLDKARALAMDFFIYQAPPTSNSLTDHFTLWKPPPSGYWKLNIDASFTNSEEAVGIAGVWRDNRGQWIKGFHRKTFASTVLMSELLAILEGLKCSQQFAWNRLIICSDSLNAVNAILDPNQIRDENFNIVTKCRLLMQGFQELKIEHSVRQENRLADGFAKYCRKSCNNVDATVLLDNPVLELMALYQEDIPP